MADKLSGVSSVLFMIANIFAITSLCMPNWIMSSMGGETYIGLLETCITISSRKLECFASDSIQPEFLITFILILSGIFCISITIFLLCFSYWRHAVVKYARWLGFAGMVLFCMAAVIFPTGFHTEQIGGEAYQLPASYHVGLGYIMFVLALWITVVSELFAGKVCLPHF